MSTADAFDAGDVRIASGDCTPDGRSTDAPPIGLVHGFASSRRGNWKNATGTKRYSRPAAESSPSTAGATAKARNRPIPRPTRRTWWARTSSPCSPTTSTRSKPLSAADFDCSPSGSTTDLEAFAACALARTAPATGEQLEGTDHLTAVPDDRFTEAVLDFLEREGL